MDKQRKKELILAYKQTPRPMGVFQVRNLVSGKIFLGTSMDLPGKLNSQRAQLSSGCHQNKDLQADWNILGPEQFSMEILETIDPEKISQDKWRDAVLELGQQKLDALHPYGEAGYHKLKKA